ncbi:MAG: aminopeptidase P family protein [Phycisphaerales bacterium]|nr:aminopeptidase P family protein [Phycisphaerales bacterium]MCB9863178.1 aminopeptidase P family protein [Phycisphaerales bacterium]
MTPSTAISKHVVTEHIARLSEELSQADADGYFVFQCCNLLGFLGLPIGPTDRLVCGLVNVQGASALVLPAFEASAANEAPDGCQIFTWEEHEDQYAALAAAASSLGLNSGRLLVDHRTWIEVRERLQDYLPGATLETDPGHLDRIRMVKSPEEIEAIRQACAHCSIVFDYVSGELRVGSTEDRLHRGIADRLIEIGASAEIVLVQSGPNGAIPHLPTGTRRFENGDAVIVDCVCRRQGYCGDMTRTYQIGETTNLLQRAYSTVRTAHDAAIDMIRPGVTASQVDATARAVIDRAGFGRAFLHRLGHGIGLEGHEAPYIVQGSDVVLQAGMCFTVEPGIYLDQSFGIRLESVVAVTPGGCELLSDMTPLDVSCEPINVVI